MVKQFRLTDTSIPASLTVAGQLVGTVAAVIRAVAPGAVFDTAAVDAAPVALLAHTVSCICKQKLYTTIYEMINI